MQVVIPKASEVSTNSGRNATFSFLIRENSREEASWAVWAFYVKLTPSMPTSGWPVIQPELKASELELFNFRQRDLCGAILPLPELRTVQRAAAIR